MKSKSKLLALISLLPFLNISSSTNNPSTDTDILCNRDTKFECICHFGRHRYYQYNENLSSKYKSCFDLIVGQSLSSLRLILSHFDNLDPIASDRLVTNTNSQLEEKITYENFFKINLSNLINLYCQRDLSRCPNVGLSIRPNSVLILNLESIDSNRLLIDYCVLRSIADADSGVIRSTSLIDARIILNATGGGGKSSELLQKLIPYPIVEHRWHNIIVHTTNTWKENLGLISALIVFACVLVFIYIIAIIKAVR